MPPVATAPPTILESILAWSLSRPLWQRDALRRIVAKGRLDDKDIIEIVALFIHEHGGPEPQDSAEPLEERHLPSNPGAAESVTITEISDVVGVNDLAPGQRLKFGDSGLTVVYGPNGAGKSGYARILKRTCRSRNPGGVLLGNVYAAPVTTSSQQAAILYSVGGTPQPPFSWKDDGNPHKLLSAVGVFDSSCAGIYIGSKNEVAARPFGLDIPDELADTCKRVETLLRAEQASQERARLPIVTSTLMQPTTLAGRAVAGLSAASDMEELRNLATLTPAELERLQQLKEDLARDPAVAAKELRIRIARTKTLVEALKRVHELTSDQALANMREAHERQVTARETARLSASLLSGSSLEGVTGVVWKELWESARRYSREVAYPTLAFPPTNTDQKCLLCQQPLTQEAIERMRGFEAFIQADTERAAHDAEVAARRLLSGLNGMKLRLREQPEGLKEISAYAPPLFKMISRYLAAARLRRFTFLRSLSEVARVPQISVPPLDEVEDQIRASETRADEMDRLGDPIQRSQRQAELHELIDRHSLATAISAVESEHSRLVMIDFLEACCKDLGTNAITNLGNRIADEAITPQLRDRFSEEVTALVSNKVRVELVRSGGRYGSPQYQVQLLAKPDAKVLNVLSEGEQTCIALAAFLTEVATMSHKSALIFDDPISSLDHRWRKQVARRLAKEAVVRQIIVFTHDLIFASDLYALAEREHVSHKQWTLSRGPAGTGVVEEGFPWQGKRVEDRLDKLLKRACDAKDLFDNRQDEEYREEAVGIYNRLRATWERALEDVAFGGVVRRHRDYIDTKNLKKTSVITEQDCELFNKGFSDCCDVTDAHDPSAGRDNEPPAPSEMLKAIQDLADWTSSIRTRQAAI